MVRHDSATYFYLYIVFKDKENDDNLWIPAIHQHHYVNTARTRFHSKAWIPLAGGLYKFEISPLHIHLHPNPFRCTYPNTATTVCMHPRPSTPCSVRSYDRCATLAWLPMPTRLSPVRHLWAYCSARAFVQAAQLPMSSSFFYMHHFTPDHPTFFVLLLCVDNAVVPCPRPVLSMNGIHTNETTCLEILVAMSYTHTFDWPNWISAHYVHTVSLQLEPPPSSPPLSLFHNKCLYVSLNYAGNIFNLCIWIEFTYSLSVVY